MQVHTYHANQSTINKCLWLDGHIMVFFICQNTTLFGQKEAHNLALMMLTADQNTVGKG